nr:winged helix DNA-binding protein [Croceibacterium sp. D39]
MNGAPFSQEDRDTLIDNLHQLARRVAELEARAASDPGAPRSLGFSDEKLRMIAGSIYRSRQFRSRYFDADLFAEPAWDMMLDLFINRVIGRRTSTSSLCLAANVPQATGLRWIAVLQKKNLLRRFGAPEDARLKLVELTADGFQLMRRFLSDSVTRFDMPMPD